MKSRRFNSKTAAMIPLPRMLMVSLAANIALGCLVAWVLLSRGSRSAPSPDSALAHLPGLQAAKTVKPQTHETQAVATVVPAPFSWEQLQSQDFPTYIAGLRGIHCPESTLRDIIKGELDEIYADKQRQLLAQRGVSSARQLPPSVQIEVDALTREEDRLLAQLLGLSSPDSTATLAEAQAGPASPVSPPSRRAAMEAIQMNQPLAKPLVLQEVDTAAMNLTPSQQERIDQMRADFLRKMAATSQDPNDPQYLIQWKKAQYQMDAQLRTSMGDDFVARYRAHVK
jgi:hypothetical protein